LNYINHDSINIARWAANVLAETTGIPCSFSENVTAIGITDNNNNPIAAAVYHDYIPEYSSVSMSIASVTPKWCTRTSINILLCYPFFQLNCERITITVAEDNLRSLKFVLGIGFVKEGFLRKGYGTKNMIILGMLKEDFLKKRLIDVKENTKRSSSARSNSNC